MKGVSLIIAAFISFFLVHTTEGQHTFSIVAIDTLTGEVGSAGATCLDDLSFPGSGGAIIISDVSPGKGAVHTQSYWREINQDNAGEKLRQGWSASAILDWLVTNDEQSRSDLRQYGVVTMTDSVDVAAFTGSSCLDEKSHRTGENYAIQGNILLAEAVLDSMEQRFLQSEGLPLCERLMTALQGANIAGADSRCLSEGVSSRSAFIRVARPTDSEDDMWMDLNVPFTSFGVEPIDELQKLFDDFKATLNVDSDSRSFFQLTSSNPSSGMIRITKSGSYLQDVQVQLFEVEGKVIFTEKWQGEEPVFNASTQHSSMVLLKVIDPQNNRVLLAKRIVLKK